MLVLYSSRLLELIILRAFIIFVIVPDIRVDFSNFNIIMLILNLFSVVLSHLLSVARLLLSMVEGADLRFIASRSIAIDSLVFVWMVEALHCGVTLVTK